MSDERLRTLERAAASGGPDERAALLRARVRAGTLSQERLELAAYVGDADARAALVAFEDDPDVDGGHPTACIPCRAFDGRNYVILRGSEWHCLKHAHEHPDLALWVRGLSRWGSEVLVTAAVAAARQALPVWASQSGCELCASSHSHIVCGHATRARRAVEAVEAWIACPCEQHWTERHEAYVDAGHRAWLPAPGDDRAHESVQHAARIAGEPAVRQAIRTALVQWALS